MDQQAWRRLVARVDGGKVVGGAKYVHVSAVPDEVLAEVRAHVATVGGPAGGFNVLKLTPGSTRLSLLNYPAFFERAFPLLSESWTIDLAEGSCDHRTYPATGNPPILHRKELLLSPGHPQRAEFEALTADAERHELFANVLTIGHRNQWDELLRSRGLRVEGHALVPIEGPTASDATVVLRHRTAMARRGLSTPMQALWRHGYLTAGHEVLDYGCGRGDDLATLGAQGIAARGWDPHFRPDAPCEEADVVNLGFVLNVIEDPRERTAALTRAYGLARKVLAVAVLLGGRTAIEQHRAYGDGVLTSRNTFQKYFGHEELAEYLSNALGREPVSVGPGLYFVFRTDEDEQDYLERRQRSWGGVLSVPARPAPTREPRRVERAPRTPRAPREKAPTKWEVHTELVEAFWLSCLELGRVPRAGEFARLDELTSNVASAPTTLRRLIEQRGADALSHARERRMGDLTVFLALNLFERRRSAGTWGARTQADLREFWGSHTKATEAAQALLFSLRDPKTVGAACEAAAARGIGWLAPGDALQFDARLVNELPPALRMFIGCAGKLCGEARDADVVKIHIASGKVSLMRYDDYEGSAIPMLVERIKVDLRRQEVHWYQYGDEFEPQPLYLKSRYMHPAMPEYEAQRAFDDALRASGTYDWSAFGPPLSELAGALATIDPPHGLQVIRPRPPSSEPRGVAASRRP